MNGNGTKEAATEASTNRVGSYLPTSQPLPTDASVRELVQKALDNETDLSQAKVARESGVHASALSQWLNGRYPGDNAEIERKLAAWLSARGERVTTRATVPDAPTFLMTPAAKKILGTFQYAQSLGEMGMVLGVPGVGKTTAIRHYQETTPNVWVATMTPYTSGVVPCFERICGSVGVGIENGAARMARSIAKRIGGTRGLLIIDESQHLSTMALDAIRSFHDELGIGIVFVGSEQLKNRLVGVGRAAQMAQLHSRLSYKVMLRGAIAADIDVLLDAWQVSGKKEREFCQAVGSKPGALRSMTKLLRLASSLASRNQCALSHEHLKDAWHSVGAND